MPVRYCSVDKCNKTFYALNLCKTHYQRLRNTGSLELIQKIPTHKKICSIDNCNSIMMARGFCRTHYRRFMKNGRPEVNISKGQPSKFKSLQENFESKFEKKDPCVCWIWNGLIAPDGYGRLIHCIKYKKVNYSAHRLSYEFYNGVIPDDHIVCHKCDNKPCVNPNHLFAGTHKDNSEDMVKKGRQARGEKNNKSKLRNFDIINIKRLIRNGLSSLEISLKYDVCKSTIEKIKNGKAWKHVEDIC